MVITNHDKPAQQKMGKKKNGQQNKTGSEASTSKADSAPDKQAKPPKKKEESSPIASETAWSDSKFNDSDLTMKQLHNMIRTLAGEVIEKKYKDLKSEMEEEVEWRVSAQTEEMQETIENMKKEISAVKEERDALKLENSKLTRRIERCEYKISRIKTKHLHDMKVKLDDIEQMFFERDVQLVGVSELPEGQENNEEELEKIVRIAKEKMNITIKDTAIEKLHRLGKRKANKPRDVVVRFRSCNVRNKFYQNRKKTVNHSDPQNSIYVNDHLTEYRRNVFYATRQLVKNNTIFAAWTQQGNILIRKKDGDQPEQIHSHEQLAEMKLIEEISGTLEEEEDDFEDYEEYTDSDF